EEYRRGSPGRGAAVRRAGFNGSRGAGAGTGLPRAGVDDRLQPAPPHRTGRRAQDRRPAAGGPPRRAAARSAPVRRLGADRRHRRAQGRRGAGHSGHLRARAQPCLPLARARSGGSGGIEGPVHRRQRARLFRLSGLPPGIRGGVRRIGAHRHQVRIGRGHRARPRAAPVPDQGGDRARSRAARAGYERKSVS
ncbi:hypothetical protein OY671_009793, partial [Metschnikowia pulcherrima]